MEAAHFSLLLFLLLAAFAADFVLAEFWNIDCGASAEHTDAATNLTWVTDSGYVRGGESHILPPNKTAGFATELATLRAFPGKTRKNCYTVSVQAKTKIEVQVAFYYGNYDGLEKPPSFELIFDSTDWATVKTEVDRWWYYTIIYVTSKNHTDICLWRLNDGEVPFVSYIQIRTLDPLMYGGLVMSNFSLYSPRRYVFGLNDTLRFPDDSYDRIWSPMNINSTSISDYEIVEHSGGAVVNTSTSLDNPPAKMFAGAITAKEASQNLTIGTDFIPSTTPTYAIYLNLYLTEIKSSLNQTEKRAFRIYIDGQEPSLNAGILTPPIGSVLEFTTPARAGGSTRITLAPTADSTLPPIVSGLEILFIGSFSDRWTDDSDAVALSSVQGNITSLQNWTGDPCLPATYNWNWVGCSKDETPRITKLYLGGLGFPGDIPDFSKLDALVFIDLQKAFQNFWLVFPNLEH